MRENIRRTRVIATAPSDLSDGRGRFRLRTAGEESEQQAFRFLLPAELRELRRRYPVGTRGLRRKGALDHRERVLMLPHRVELAGRGASRARRAERIVVSISSDQILRRGKGVLGSSRLAQESDEPFLRLGVGRSLAGELSQRALRRNFPSAIREDLHCLEPRGEGKPLVECEPLEPVDLTELLR